MMQKIIEVKSLVTKFDDVVVHDGINFYMQKGSVCAVIGGSGCGKSTLLREIISLHRPTSGKIFLFEHDVLSSSSEVLDNLRKRYGVLFQNGALFSNLTVEENISVPLLEQTNLTSQAISSIAKLRLSLTGLALDTLHKMPSELSGGMRKRVALARALALEPELLFLDEPTSGLDPINARAFDTLVRTLADSLGLSVFMVTHDLDTIESIVDQVIVLADGRVLADGAVSDIKNVDHTWIQTYFSSRTVG